ncbi:MULTISPECIES: sigma factor-like helix-turn-helix DNA-binding protein [unclassified Bradyrhizobium]|uniref:sigma factor-like helix-turn-helix DNA-binding protein n=1 Tax=unclassified Bradyrhizobium TaxID=2631580 RepID=UPI001CD1CDCE|nr:MULTISPECIES: sigma factor-like helix-turn-helix DNA-binding protein [unclassified Bradyrhizobium]MCA1373569.1 helix-turn-helix domain-containing protein [Bradyrhizobium sp. IC4060]MCA1487212.1 helix-turn-helix domain-containing protein [Bradyrhizobium sp. IC4061]
MAKSAEVDDPSQRAAAGTVTPARRTSAVADVSGVPPLLKYTRRPEVAEELERWYALSDIAQGEEIKRAVAREKRWSIETFVHAVIAAYASGDKRKYIQTFNGFATRATSLLWAQSRKLKAPDKEDHAQEVLLLTAKDVQSGKAEYAEANFADYAMRKGIDVSRRRDAAFEGKFIAVEPDTSVHSEDGDSPDPLDTVAERVPSPEARALLRHSVGKLEGVLREVFIQYHVHGLTYEEIAEHHDVDESTIRNWVKRAGRLVGHQGGNDDHED